MLIRWSRAAVMAISTWQPMGMDPFHNITLGPDGGPYPCPCCRYVTLSERGGDEICPVCFWEDDGQGDHDADVVRRMSRPVWNLGDGLEQLSYAATSFSGQ